jgi:hypothetical protein
MGPLRHVRGFRKLNAPSSQGKVVPPSVISGLAAKLANGQRNNPYGDTEETQNAQRVGSFEMH